jgi:hypothetical protein
MIHMLLKWHHVDKCNKNWRKVDILTSILAHLSSSTLKLLHMVKINSQKYKDD